MKSFNLVLIAALVLSACETRYVDVGDHPDAESDTLPDSLAELCSDGLDNDMDGLVDCRDGDGAEDCSAVPACQDAGSDADADEAEAEEDSVEADVPPVELCSDGVDNDFDGLVDCRDHADCDTDPACLDAAEEADAPDSESDSGVDSDPAVDPLPDTVPDTDPDTASDPDAVDSEADSVGLLHTGLATFKWCRPASDPRYPRIQAECYIASSSGATVDDWSAWETVSDSPDASVTDADCIEFTVPSYALAGGLVRCNATAFDPAIPAMRIYAVGQCSCPGACVAKGTLIVRSGLDADDPTALDLTSLLVQEPRCATVGDTAGNYLLSPLP